MMKVTWFFKDDRGSGWSESFYNQGDLPSIVYPKALALVDVRRGILGREAQITDIRVSKDDAFRDSALKSFGPAEAPGTFPPEFEDTNTDFADTALLVLMYSTSSIKGHLFMRGIPDSIVSDAGQYLPSAVFINAFNAWRFALLQDASWGNRYAAGTGPKTEIITISQSSLTGKLRVTTLGAHGFVPGDLVALRGGKGARAARGRYKVLTTTADGLSFEVACKKLVLPYDGGMTAQKVTFAFIPYNNATVVRITRRKAGRPFGALVGRQKNLV